MGRRPEVETHRQDGDDNQEDGRAPLDQTLRYLAVDGGQVVDAGDSKEESSAGETAATDRVEARRVLAQPPERSDGLQECLVSYSIHVKLKRKLT